MIGDLEFAGLRRTCRMRHNTEQKSLLPTVWKGSSNGVVANGFSVLTPGGSPCPPVTQAGSAGAFPAQNVPDHGAAAPPGLRRQSRAAAPLPLFPHKEEESSEPGQLSESLPKSCYARDPWKGGSMSDIWLKHAVLQPSSASVWSPEYHCQLGSNLHWAWESGTLAVSLMVFSPLLHWFQICS